MRVAPGLFALCVAFSAASCALLRRPRLAPCPVIHERFRCGIDRAWKGPERVAGGVLFREPGGRASISMVFHAEGSAEWKPPPAYRQHLREQGSPEDGHVLFEVKLSSRAAHRIRFTTHEYDPRYLLGERREVFYTDVVLVPDPAGIFLFRYEAPKRLFPRWEGRFEEFLGSLDFTEPKKKPVGP